MTGFLDRGRIRKWRSRLREVNGVVMYVILALCALGIAMLYSASGAHVWPWAGAQAIRLVIGLTAMLIIAITPMRRLMSLAYPIYGLLLMMLVLVEIAGVVGLGAQRWVSVGIFTLQPSELMKLGLILAIARYFQSVQLESARHLYLLIAPVIMMAMPAILILLQPNLGTATITLFIGFVMCFMAGIRWYYFAGAITAVAASLPIGWQFLHDYQKRRVLTFLDPTADPLGAGYNILQSMIAIGSGGMFGKGLTQGSQGQLDFLPEKQTDFIFTMLAEELGFAGSVMLLTLYGVLIVFALTIVVRSRHAFGRLVAAGVASMLFAHIFINMAMVMGMIPVVGVPLPFLSYGGSFLIATLAACGLLLNAHIHKDQYLPRGGSGFGI
jgi:rod shape determining protein RodA